jgi:hypothetical protein
MAKKREKAVTRKGTQDPRRKDPVELPPLLETAIAWINSVPMERVWPASHEFFKNAPSQADVGG